MKIGDITSVSGADLASWVVYRENNESKVGVVVCWNGVGGDKFIVEIKRNGAQTSNFKGLVYIVPNVKIDIDPNSFTSKSLDIPGGVSAKDSNYLAFATESREIYRVNLSNGVASERSIDGCFTKWSLVYEKACGFGSLIDVEF